MNGIKAFLKKNALNFLLPLALTLWTAVLVTWVYDVRYMANDDAVICNIAAGAFGADSQYLVFVNILIGWLMKVLTRLESTRNWLLYFAMAGGIFAVSILGKLLLDRVGRRVGCVVFALLLLFMGPDFFSIFYFAEYAALLTAAGIILVWSSLGKWSVCTILGILLASLGSMFRFEFFIITGGMSAIALAYEAFTRPAEKRKTACLIIAALVALPLGLRLVDYLCYHLQPEWRDFLDYSLVRAEILDYRKYHFTDHSVLAGIGFSENDYFMVEKWLAYDPDYFTTERLQELLSVMPRSSGTLSLSDVKALLTHFFFGNNLHLAHTTILALLIFYHAPRNRVPILGILGTHLLMVCYLCWRGRYIPRAQESMMLASSLLLLCCFRGVPLAQKRRRWRVIAVLLATALAIPGLVRLREEQTAYFAKYVWREKVLAEIPQRKNDLYLVNVLLVDDLNGYHVWRTKPAGYFSNIVFVGSWMMHSPLQDNILAAHGIANPYRDAVDREDVYWIEEDFYVAQKEAYIRAHYAPDAQFVRIDRRPIFSFYQVSTDPEVQARAVP